MTVRLFGSVARQLKSIFSHGKKPRVPLRVQRRIRPILETLEERAVPTILVWAPPAGGGAKYFDDANNWELTNGNPANVYPTSTDEVTFVVINTDCYLRQNQTVAGLWLATRWTGTLHLDSGSTANILTVAYNTAAGQQWKCELDGGTIAATTNSGCQLRIDASTNLNVVNAYFQAANLQFHPASGSESQLIINANVNFDCGEGDTSPGTLDAAVSVNDQAFFLYDSAATGDIDMNGNGSFEINQGGTFDYDAVGNNIVNYASNASFLVNGGKFYALDAVGIIKAACVNAGTVVLDRSAITFKGTITNSGQTFAFENATGASNLALTQSNTLADIGILHCEDSSGNDAEFWQHAGKIDTSGDSAASNHAQITCATLFMDGGQIFDVNDASFTNYLDISGIGLTGGGNVTIQGGTIYVDLNAGTTTVWDKITCRGTWTWQSVSGGGTAGTLDMTTSGTPAAGTYDVLDTGGFSGTDFSVVMQTGHRYTSYGKSGNNYVFTQ